jgi:1,4-dihydroxy-2-naphthoate octaprenyltransferase
MDSITLIKIIKLGRFQFVIGGFLFFYAGSFLAIILGAEFLLSKFIMGYLILFMAHLAVSYSNDYFDANTDKYNNPTKVSGGSGILVDNPELKKYAKWISIALICLSLTLGAAFTVIFSYTVFFFLFVVFENLLVWFYSAPPIKLAYRGLSEVSTTIAGFLIPGMGYFTLMGTLDVYFLIFAVPMMLYELFFINSVEIPDMEGDKIGGKITWIVKRGRKFGFKIIAISGLLATISFILIYFMNIYPQIIDFRIITIISFIPLTFGIIGLLKKPVDRILATNLVTYNVSSLFVSAILINIYFLYILNYS